MFRFTKSWVFAALTTIFAMMLSVLGGVSSASASKPELQSPTLPGCVQLAVDPEYPFVPPPWQCDRSGSDQDTYFVSYSDPPPGRYVYITWFSGGIRAPFVDQEVPTLGKDRVVLTAWLWDNSVSTLVPGPTWSLDYNLAATAVEAPNHFTFELGACDSYLMKYEVTPRFVNVDDATDRTVKRAFLWLYYDGGKDLVSAHPQFVEGVADGQSDAYMVYRLYPGDYPIFMSYKQRGPKVQMDTLHVPKCGAMVPPGQEPAQPTIRVKQFGKNKMRVRVDNRKVVDRATKFKVRIKKPGRSRKQVKTFVVRPGKLQQRTFRRRVGTTFVVKARVPVAVGYSSYKLKWKVVGRRTLRRR